MTEPLVGDRARLLDRGMEFNKGTITKVRFHPEEYDRIRSWEVTVECYDDFGEHEYVGTIVTIWMNQTEWDVHVRS